MNLIGMLAIIDFLIFIVMLTLDTFFKISGKGKESLIARVWPVVGILSLLSSILLAFIYLLWLAIG